MVMLELEGIRKKPQNSYCWLVLDGRSTRLPSCRIHILMVGGAEYPPSALVERLQKGVPSSSVRLAQMLDAGHGRAFLQATMIISKAAHGCRQPFR